MLSAINAIDRKLHVAGHKPLKEMAEPGEFVGGGRFLHEVMISSPLLAD